MNLNVYECTFLIVLAAVFFGDASAWALVWAWLSVVWSHSDGAK